MTRIKATLVVLLCLPAFVLAQEVPAEFRDAISRIDAMTAAELAKDNIGSVTVGVVHGKNLIWTKSYGYADDEKKIPATRDSVYRIGSITKQFTALMLLQLVEAGKVRLSDPVEKYFPQINQVQGRFQGAPAITLVQLATMTSGMDREPEDLPTYLKGPVSEWENVTLSALGRTRYRYEPNTHYFYSNIGYAALGAALSRAAGEPYVRYVATKIFEPLGMTHTAFEPNDAIRKALTIGYEVDRNGRASSDAPQREHAGRGYKVPNGAMYTTVSDLARFVAWELGEVPGLLKKEFQDDTYSRVMTATGDFRQGYGVGFQLSRRGDHVFLGHGGSVAGYRAEAYVDRLHKTGVIVLRNAGGGKFNLSDLTMRALMELAEARKRATQNR